MHKTELAAEAKLTTGLRTSFPTVPIAEVPLPIDSARGSDCRPIVLVVDDEPIVADTLAEILIRSGYVAIAAYDGESALETAALVPPDLLIADDLSPEVERRRSRLCRKKRIPGLQNHLALRATISR